MGALQTPDARRQNSHRRALTAPSAHIHFETTPMALHSRPLPAPPVAGHDVSDPMHTPPENSAAPPRASGTEPADRSAAESERARQVAPPSRTGEGDAPWPWYRSEPWFAVMLAALVPMFAAVLAPEAAKYPLIGISALAELLGLAMLLRQGVFHSHPPPSGARAAERAARSRDSARAEAGGERAR